MSVFDEEQLHFVHRKVEDAVANSDGAAFAQLYTDDGVLYPPDGTRIVGRGAIRETFIGWITAGFSRQTVEVIDFQVSGNFAIEEGRAIGRFEVDGEVREARSNYLITHLRQNDGGWLMLHDMWTAIPEGLSAEVGRY